MGSDDGAKGKGRPWLGAAFFLVFFVGPMLILESVLATRRRDVVAAARIAQEARAVAAVAPAEAARSLDAAPAAPAAVPHEAPLAPPPDFEADASLLDALLDLALLDPAAAVAALARDPLGVANVSDPGAWRCPRSRVLTRDPLRNPSAAAAAALRDRRPGAFVWFDHLSKAGGTSFCEFARRNLGVKRTPSYYCMPSDGAAIDGRVGRWPSDKLDAYLDRTRHQVVANEWDPFPAGPLDARFRDVAVLATIVRDPLDRLVSTYKFWGILNNPAKVKPDLVPWLERHDASARRTPLRNAGGDFLSQVGRNNFAVWKFAAHASPRFDDCGGDRRCGRDALAAAIGALERFHVAAPTNWQAAAGPLYAELGFARLDEVHIVNMGKVQHSSSRAALSPADFDDLAGKNALDLALWHWARRAFLERLHCPPL